MDVSQPIDQLFAGVVPERLIGLKEAWGENLERVRLVSAHRFMLQQGYGTIQVSELALAQLWATGLAAEAAIQAWGTAKLPELQHAAFEDFNVKFDAINGVSKAATLGDFHWPTGALLPQLPFKFRGSRDQVAYDLNCIAAAYVFAHEVSHNMFDATRNASSDHLTEEWECDRWAAELLLDEAEEYGAAMGWQPHSTRSKRVLGMLAATLLMLVLTLPINWTIPTDHPPVLERIRYVLGAVDANQVANWFWPSASAMLFMFASRLGVQFSVTGNFKDTRELAYSVCDALTAHSREA